MSDAPLSADDIFGPAARRRQIALADAERRPTGQTPALRDVLHDVRAFNLKFVVLNVPQATILAPFIVMTHAVEAFDFTVYVNVTSPMPECGKTRQLEVMEALVKHPWLTGRVTPAVLMRKVDAEAPVLLLDETDAAFAGDPTYSEALRGMLNAGFHRSGKASVCVGQGSKIQVQRLLGLRAEGGGRHRPPPGHRRESCDSHYAPTPDEGRICPEVATAGMLGAGQRDPRPHRRADDVERHRDVAGCAAGDS